MALQPGDALFNGHYRIIRQLGRGGFGFVYLAQDTLLAEEVAIKELIPALVGDETSLKRFLAEAKATMRLTHKRIVRTHNVSSEADNYYIVMEFMPTGGQSFMIWVVDSDGASERQLTFQRLETGTADRDPTWSPDGQQIAFASNGDGTKGIHIMNADGSGIRRLTDHSDTASAPAWSPDGKRIAFSASQDGSRFIFVMNSDGSNVQYLAQGTGPAWSP